MFVEPQKKIHPFFFFLGGGGVIKGITNIVKFSQKKKQKERTWHIEH